MIFDNEHYAYDTMMKMMKYEEENGPIDIKEFGLISWLVNIML